MLVKGSLIILSYVQLDDMASDLWNAIVQNIYALTSYIKREVKDVDF